MEQVIRAAINSGAVHLQHLSKSLPSVLQPDAGAGGSERLVLALAAANIVALLLWPTSRRVIVNILDTTLAIVLIICLAGIVVGLPIGTQAPRAQRVHRIHRGPVPDLQGAGLPGILLGVHGCVCQARGVGQGDHCLPSMMTQFCSVVFVVLRTR